MPIEKDKIRKDIIERPCECCGEAIDESDYASEDTSPVLTFFRGSFIMLHSECARMFIDTAQKGPRGIRDSAG